MTYTDPFHEYLDKLKPVPVMGVTKQTIFDNYVRHVASKGLPVEASYDSLSDSTTLRLVNENLSGACTPMSWALGQENRRKIKKAICPATGWNQWKEKNLVHLLFVEAAKYPGEQQKDRDIPAIDLRDRYLEMLSSKTSTLVISTPEVGFLVEIHAEITQKIQNWICTSTLTWYNYSYPVSIQALASEAFLPVTARHGLSQSVLKF